MKVYTGSASVECDGIVMSGNGSGPVRVYAGGATVDVVRADPPPVNTTLPAVGELRVEKLNRGRVVWVDGWHVGGGAYTRWQQFQTVKPGLVKFDIGRQSFASAIPADTAAREFSLLIDGVEMGRAAMAEGSNHTVVSVDVSGLASGWHTLRAGNLIGDECSPTWFFCLVRDGEPRPALMPRSTGSYDFHWDSPRNEHAWTMIPAVYDPPAVPLPEHGEYAHFNTVAKSVRVDMLVPGAGGNVFLPNVNSEGVVSSFCRQAYYWDDFVRELPRVTLLDGSRGVGSLPFVSHIEIGKAAPMSTGPINNIYGTDPWRVWKVRDNGTIITLAGYRHRGMGSYWKDEPGQTLELVGDWSAIPEERRGFHTIWGMCWDATSLVTDESAEPIPTERNLRPHLGAGPRMLVTDSQRNRICALQFSPVQHGVPAKVTEWMTGLLDPWDIVEDEARNCYYVSERAANRIIEVDRQGVYVRTLIERDPANPVECYLRKARHEMGLRGGDAATRKEVAQLHPCIGPEGLCLLGDWLYFGSLMLRQVRRVHVVTGEWQVVCEPQLDGNSKFMKLAVGDGTFGPRETIFVQTWSIYSVHQNIYLPDGSMWKLSQSVPWGSTGYGSAVAQRDGRLVTGTSNYGLRRASAGVPFDRAKYEKGEKEYEALHGRILWGTQGFNTFKAPLPWGRSEFIDYFLATNGHRPEG